jgi:hypothetical protein
MIKVFEDFDFSRVGQMQSLLEAHGIRTYIRNQYGSSVMGEVPFIEVVPQLFILDHEDLARALELLQPGCPDNTTDSSWCCPACGADVEGNFDRCWNCGASRDRGPDS